MSTAIAAPESMGRLLHRLGDISADRVWLVPSPGSATEEDVISALHRADRRRCELIDGVLVEKFMGWYEARLAIILGHFIEGFLDDRDLGMTIGPDGPHRLWQGRIRYPDMAYISNESLPAQVSRSQAIADWVPDLAVEVLSKSNTRREMKQKLQDYFQSGVKLVWYVHPTKRRVRVYHSPSDVRILTESDVLSGEDVLPGFTLAISKWFERADRALRGRAS